MRKRNLDFRFRNGPRRWPSFLIVALSSSVALCDLPDSLPEYFVPVTSPGQKTRWINQVEIDFQSLLKKCGAVQPLDASSIRVVDEAGKVCPTSFVPKSRNEQAGTVFWNVDPSDSEIYHRIYFSQVGKRWPAVELASFRSGNYLPENGLDNGRRLPPGTTLEAQGGRNGGACLRLEPKATISEELPFQNSFDSEKVSVVGGEDYRFEVSAKYEGTDEANPLYAASVYWYRSDGSYIQHEELARGTDTLHDWSSHSRILRAPQEGAFCMVSTSFYAEHGDLFLDELIIFSEDGLALTTVNSADGTKSFPIDAKSD